VSPGQVALAVAAVVLLAVYVSWTAGRLDRMHARVDASWAALDAQLVRRAAAARALVPLLPDPVAGELDTLTHVALEVGQRGREAVENDLSAPAAHGAAAPAGRHRPRRAGERRLPGGPGALLPQHRRQGHPRPAAAGGCPARSAGRSARLPEFFEIDDTALRDVRGAGARTP
jgi:hypothetical protein